MLAKITREPALITGVVTAALGLAVLFGIDLSEEQTGGIIVLLGAVMALVRFLTTPSAEVAVQVVDGQVLAGSASTVANGTPVSTLEGDGPSSVAALAPIKPDLL